MKSLDKFWENKSLEQLNHEEWESLCDGCGKCCSHKLLDAETNQVFFTSVTCKLFDPSTCTCTDYENRISRVSTCLKISLDNPEVFNWLPKTCSYRLLYAGEQLPSWHHLISGDKQLVHTKNHSVKGRVIYESDLEEDELIEDFVLDT